MKIEKLQVTVEPFCIYDGIIKLSVKTWITGRTHEIHIAINEDHFSSLFDNMLNVAGEMLKSAVKDNANGRHTSQR